MSAFLVNDLHIDALLTYAQRAKWVRPSYYCHNEKQVTFFDNLDSIGQTLVDQNFRSVNHRYSTEAEITNYYFTPYSRLLSPVEAIKACDCYNYQACDTGDEYWKSEAHEIIDTIRERAIDELPGMDDAAWEIS